MCDMLLGSGVLFEFTRYMLGKVVSASAYSEQLKGICTDCGTGCQQQARCLSVVKIRLKLFSEYLA
jgi:hypothetical protein